mmetsp:Transcript_21185/g.42753  ORF Transcript_21185/g.42753 Transcript_21185/m.42753 type:complete len:169 (-) Transcript_21185:303-809(-)
MLTRIVGRHFFSPKEHVWFKAMKHRNIKGGWIVSLGLTERGIEDIGDIECIEPMFGTVKFDGKDLGEVKMGEPLLSVKWDGMTQNAADELYHTSWEMISGEKVLSSLVSGIVEKFCVDPLHQEIDPHDVLVEIATDEHSIRSALKELVEEDEYLENVKQAERGKFSDT